MLGPVATRRILLQLTSAASLCSAARAFAITGGSPTFGGTSLSQHQNHPLSSSQRRLMSSSSAATGSTALKATVTSPNSGGLYLFDFDGVVCDSCDECTVSALRTVRRLGALDQPLDTVPDYPPKWLFDKMREIRPAIEVGWQIPVLLSVFLNQQHAQEQSGKTAMSVDDIIANYEQLVDEWLAKYDKADRDMIDTFGSIRDDWIATDLNSWLDINAFYPGVAESMNDCNGEGVLVTTKQQRFAIALCRHAGVAETALPDEDIYGLGMYKKKADVIVDRMVARGYDSDATHFFEDRWPTLAKCLDDDRLEGVKLYLCSWGYVTDAERALAEAEPRVKVIELDDFASIVSKK